jgi:hypothetical protein
MAKKESNARIKTGQTGIIGGARYTTAYDLIQKQKKKTAVPGFDTYKPMETTPKQASMFTANDVGKPKNVKPKGGTPYNEDMSNRVTVKEEPMPSYMKTAERPNAGKLDNSVYDGGWDDKKEEEKKPKQVSSANDAMRSAQDLLNPSAKMRRQKGY